MKLSILVAGIFASAIALAGESQKTEWREITKVSELSTGHVVRINPGLTLLPVYQYRVSSKVGNCTVSTGSKIKWGEAYFAEATEWKVKSAWSMGQTHYVYLGTFDQADDREIKVECPYDMTIEEFKKTGIEPIDARKPVQVLVFSR